MNEVKVQWDLGSPSFIGVMTCCSCLENQTGFLFSGFNFSSPSFTQFSFEPTEWKIRSFTAGFFFTQYLQRGALNICLPLALATLNMRQGNTKKTVNAEYLVQPSFYFGFKWNATVSDSQVFPKERK